MYTETELRDAMQHAAARADHRMAAEQHPRVGSEPFRTIGAQVPIDRAPSTRRRTWLPATAAAAAVAVVAGGGLLLADKPASRAPASPHHDAAAATPTASPGGPAVAAPRTAVRITNLITVPGDNQYLVGARAESLTAPAGLGGIRVMALPASGFEPVRLLRSPHPVSVARTHGYAGKALIDLIDPTDSQQAGKAGKPRNTVAWQAGNGTWLVLQSGMAGGPDFTDVPVATLIGDAERIGIKAAPAPLRSGYRARWLPAGMTLTGTSASVGDPAVALTLTAKSGSLDIELDSVQPHLVPTSGASIASKHIPGYWVSVFGSGYDRATVQRVLDGLDFSRLHGPRSGWWTLEQAVNG